eukprot:4501739-Lingulodinium_polyedra.AAC.1
MGMGRQQIHPAAARHGESIEQLRSECAQIQAAGCQRAADGGAYAAVDQRKRLDRMVEART